MSQSRDRYNGGPKEEVVNFHRKRGKIIESFIEAMTQRVVS